MIEKKNEKISLIEQATLLSLSRSGLYYQQIGPSPKEIATKHRIDELYTLLAILWLQKDHSRSQEGNDNIKENCAKIYARNGIGGDWATA